MTSAVSRAATATAAAATRLPSGLISYGPDANCTLALCDIRQSVYQYRPSLPANSVFLALFAVAMILHVIYGLRKWREYFFVSSMVLGCISEIIGYVGRIMLYYNPFSFNAFLMQICCISFAPVFYCAAIYVLLSRTTTALDAKLSRFPPKFWLWTFLPCDLVSLVLQALGGATSSTSRGVSKTGVNISIAGLSFQVITLFVFCCACVDYGVRYARKAGRPKTDRAFKIYLSCLCTAIVLIYIRCAYRIQELRKGYHSDLMANQGLFIGLEGVMIILAAFVLLGAMPGPGLSHLETKRNAEKLGGSHSGSDAEDAKESSARKNEV